MVTAGTEVIISVLVALAFFACAFGCMVFFSFHSQRVIEKSVSEDLQQILRTCRTVGIDGRLVELEGDVGDGAGATSGGTSPFCAVTATADRAV